MSAISPITPSTLEAVVVGGDLSRLTPAQRLEWYSSRCEAAGLDPRTQPFQYLSLSGKLVLYATKAATDQLIATHRLTVEVLDRKHLPDLGLYEVVARVTRQDGTHVDDMAAVPVAGLKGEAAANALMKAVTKAKRRTVLSACGLGMLDETETEAIPGARVVPVNHGTGEVSHFPAPAAPPESKAVNAHGLTADDKAVVVDMAKASGFDAKALKSLMRGVANVDSFADLTQEGYGRLLDALDAAEVARAAFEDEATRAVTGQM